MYRFRSICDTKERGTIYNNVIIAHFNYCPMVWHVCGKTSTKKIELIQERAFIILLNDPEYISWIIRKKQLYKNAYQMYHSNRRF